MIIIQELLLFKFYAVFRLMWDKKYRKDLLKLRDKLSAYRYRGTKSQLPLCQIHFSHDINYHNWVKKLETELEKNGELKRIKVLWFKEDNLWRVIDGNHRLMAYNNYFGSYSSKSIKVLILTPCP